MIDRIAGRVGPSTAAGASRATSAATRTGATGASATERAFSLDGRQGAAAASPVGPGSEPSALGRTLRVAMNRLERQRASIDRAIRQARGGQAFSPAELLALQSQVYTYSQELEVVSRMVDRTVSSLKTTLNTQL